MGVARRGRGGARAPREASASRPLRGVLLDVDGTLLDSNDAHARSWVDALTESGRRASVEEVRRLVGMGSDKLIPRVTGVAKDTPEGERLAERKKEIFNERYLPHLRAFPGARALLERLRADGLALVVATSAAKDEMRLLLKQAGVDDLIDDATSSGDADRSKPDPDIVEAALGESGHPPDEVVMLGDTPYDVEASTRAGVAVVALRCGGWDDEALRGAVAIYDDPADLLAHYEESPLGHGVGAR